MPPAGRRDELIEVLFQRLDRFEDALSKMQQALARIEQAEEESKQFRTSSVLRMDGMEQRIRALEQTKDRAEGAAHGAHWLWKLLMAMGLVGGGAAVRHLISK